MPNSTSPGPRLSSIPGMKRSYKEALPWPSAYRRLGVLKEFRGESGRADFKKLDSAAKKLDLSSKQIARLRREKAMWLAIFDHGSPPARDLPGYVSRIRKLNLGPLKDVALYDVYRKAGQTKTAERILESARARERTSLTVAIGLFGLLALAACGGFVLAVLFLVANAPRFATAPRAWLIWSAGVSSFVVYLASYIGLGAAAAIAGEGIGEKWVDASYMGLVIACALAAYALGMSVLTGNTRRAGLDWREIGYRTRSVGRDVLTGLGGFIAALPFLFVAAMITWALGQTVFKHVPTPEQPFQGIVSSGGVLAIVLTFVGASVVAPFVEETFFRGVLYTTLRGKMGVWGAMAISAAMFAVVHPLPGGFLPIFALGCVFALMRERTGSLAPSMVCHCVYNTVQLLIVLFFF